MIEILNGVIFWVLAIIGIIEVYFLVKKKPTWTNRYSRLLPRWADFTIAACWFVFIVIMDGFPWMDRWLLAALSFWVGHLTLTNIERYKDEHKTE